MIRGNEDLWVSAEEIAVAYATTEDVGEKEVLTNQLFKLMRNYIHMCANNAVKRARVNYGIYIPKEDFISYYSQYLWEALRDFDVKGKSTFRNIVIRRFSLAEIHTSRMYRTKGSQKDKDGFTYDSARWESLDRFIGTRDGEHEPRTLGETLRDEWDWETEIIENYDVELILNKFRNENERYARVIQLIYLGYEGAELAQAAGEADVYNAKVRKLVQRAKKNFRKFLESAS